MNYKKKFNKIRQELLDLSHELGDPANNLIILSEGNVSAWVDKNSFLVKASGSELRTLSEEQIIHVRFDPILSLLDQKLDQDNIQKALLDSRIDPHALIPSIETIFHAWLLNQPGVKFAGHVHPDEVNQILCSERANDFALERLFPDQIVCCGPKSLLIDYDNPGVELAKLIRKGWKEFQKQNEYYPVLILLKNHGLIALGETPRAVLATTKMMVKAARVFAGACVMGGPVFMNQYEVDRISTRLDEKYRQRLIKG